jgi:hypothetical protein
MSTPTPYRGIAVGNGILVGVKGGTTDYRTSTDGLTWTNRTMAFSITPDMNPIIFWSVTSLFYLSENNGGKIWKSSNGTTWTAAYTELGPTDFTFAVSGRILFAFSTLQGLILSTTDGTTWTRRRGSVNGPVQSYANIIQCANGSLFHCNGTTGALISRPLHAS